MHIKAVNTLSILRKKETETDRQRKTERGRQRDRETERDTERERTSVPTLSWEGKVID